MARHAAFFARGPQPVAAAGPRSASAPGPLGRRRDTDAFELQHVDAAAAVEAQLARHPTVDHGTDAGDRQRALRDVGRQHDLALALRQDRAILRVAVEAASPFGWTRYVASEQDVIGMTSFGASAPIDPLYQHFGITAGHVAARVRALLGRG